MLKTTLLKQYINQIKYFFPVQLLVLHFKRNQILVSLWLLLFGYATKKIGIKFGIANLFLSPEYLDAVNFLSFALVGFFLGGFIMVFNIYSYIRYSYLFPFLATISRPFYKFTLNNLFFPLLFIIVYIYNSILFQLNIEFISPIDIFIHIISFILGIFIFILLSFIYFFSFNKNVFYFLKVGSEELKKVFRNINASFKNKKQTTFIQDRDKIWRVDTYLRTPLRIKLARTGTYYSKRLLKKVFEQNHINASFFNFGLIVSFLIIGLLNHYPVFNIPSVASLFLLLTLLLMMFSIVSSWLRGWTVSFVILAFLVLNFFSSKYNHFFTPNSYAYGLNYDTVKAQYNYDNLQLLAQNDTNFINDYEASIQILQKWKQKNKKHIKGKKPPIIFLSTSGGGARASLWTYRVIQYVDSLLKGDLFKHIHLISGSSGGLIGAAYLRELFIAYKQKGMNYYDFPMLANNIAKDILNPILLSIATNDIFIRFQTVKVGGYRYTKDRGYSFERYFNKNTNYVLNKTLQDNFYYEKESLIPTLIIAPTIINDGRRLLISSQNISYLTHQNVSSKLSFTPTFDNIEFKRLFKNQNAQNLQLLTALRMNATFPYISPAISLPSHPVIEVMDAGLRDNYGKVISLQFIFAFKEWIENNTDRIILIQISDTKRIPDIEIIKPSIYNYITSPVSNFFSNLSTIQKYNQDHLLQFMDKFCKKNIDVINFDLNSAKEVSLSWHLTTFEKKKILNSIFLDHNVNSLNKLKSILNPDEF